MSLQHPRTQTVFNSTENHYRDVPMERLYSGINLYSQINFLLPNLYAQSSPSENVLDVLTSSR
jgi:pyoverdine/dityrosine biosynthesis protein Dit1